MNTITVQSIKAQSHPQTKALFWYLFGTSRGGHTRTRIVTLLRDKPSNQHQLSKDLELEYKGIGHHLSVLEKNGLVGRMGEKYGATYFMTDMFLQGEQLFDEIIGLLQKTGDDKWSR